MKIVIKVVGEAKTGKSTIAHEISHVLRQLGFRICESYLENKKHLHGNLDLNREDRLNAVKNKISIIEIEEIQVRRGSMRIVEPVGD